MRRSGRWVMVAVTASLVACGDHGQDPVDSGHADAPASVTVPVGTGGGMVTADGVTITIPPGALPSDTPITITTSPADPPAGYQSLSRIYHLEPEGLTFLQPISIELAFTGASDHLTVFWSKLGTPGFDDVGGAITGSSITASNTHFSSVFGGIGPAELVVNPISRDFGTQPINLASAVQFFTVTNTGGTASTALSVALAGSDAASYLFGPGLGTCDGAILPPDGTCSIAVAFAPQSPGAKAASIAITAAGSAPATIALIGTGITADGLVLTPSSFDFGSVAVGTPSSSATFNVMNLSGATSGALTVELAGTNASDFEIITDTCDGVVLAPSAGCSITVDARATAGGSRSAALVISGVPGGTVTGALSVSALTPADLSIAPGVRDFGTVAIASQSPSTTFVVHNSGALASGALAVALSGAHAGDFIVDSDQCSGTIVQGGGTCSFSVHFTPTTAQAVTATATVTGADAPATVALSGTGAPTAALAASPSSISFGAVLSGSTSATHVVTITNAGAGASGSLAAALGGDSPGNFAIATDTCSGVSLAPAAACTIGLAFRPAGIGPSTATLAVGGLTVALDGSGFAAAALSSSQSALDFGSVATGMASVPATITIRNTGGAPSGALVTTLSGAAALAFVVEADSCAGTTLLAGATCAVSLHVAPTTTGVASAQLAVAATPGGSVNVALSAAGTAPADLVISPSLQNLGGVLVGEIGAPFLFTISNPGGNASGPLAVALQGANATEVTIASNTCTGVLAGGGATCTVSVRFAPLSRAPKAAALVITGTPGGTTSASLTGTGLAPAHFSITPGSRAFAPLPIGSISAAGSFSITNDGDVTSALPDVAFAGASPSEFTLASSSCTAGLAPAASCTVGIAYSPSELGAVSAVLQVTGASAALTGTGLTPASLSISPPSFNGGSVAAGTIGASQQFTVTNTGQAVSGGLTIATSGANASQFALLANTCSAALAGGETCTFSIRFAPTSTGAMGAAVTASAAPGGSATAGLSGMGLVPAVLQTALPLYNFGTVSVGASSAVVGFTFANGGQVSTGAITAQLGGADAGQFTKVDSCSGPALAPAGSCNVSVRFAPTSPGPRAATLTVTATPGGTVTVALAGTGGPAGAITASEAAYDYGVVSIEHLNVLHLFTFTNTGTTTTLMPVVTIGGTDAALFEKAGGNCEDAPLAPGASCALNIRFISGTLGPRSATLICDATGGPPVVVALSGTGGDPAVIELSPSSHAFGSVAVGSDVSFDFTVTNTGGSPTGDILNGIYDDFTGIISPDFSTTGCIGPLAVGASCTLTVHFAPQTAGAKANIILAVGSGIDNSGGQADLTGTGTVVSGAITASEAAYDYGVVSIEHLNVLHLFTFTNTGTTTTLMPVVTIGGTDAALFEKAGGNCEDAPLAPGASCALNIRFISGTLGPRSATLICDATGGPPVVVALSGTGGDPAVIELSPSSHAFGSVAVGSDVSFDFTVTNTGGSPTGDILNGIYDDFTGITSPDFSTTGCIGPLAVGASCTLTVHFAPQTAGTKPNIVLDVGSQIDYSQPEADLTGVGI